MTFITYPFVGRLPNFEKLLLQLAKVLKHGNNLTSRTVLSIFVKKKNLSSKRYGQQAMLE